MTNSLSPDQLRAPTVDASGKRRWIYPDRRKGPISRRRGLLASLLFVIYMLAPFISIQGMPLIRFAVLEGIVYVLGQSFRFADGSYLVFVLLILALSLGFVTSIWGRIWCSYACPQTVFVEWIIRPIEEWIEGPALRRKMRDAGPLTFDLMLRKILKYGLFLLVIWGISNAFLAYFIEPRTLWDWMLSSPREHPFAFGFMILVFVALFFDLVWFREQFCSFLCPYARFQSLMMGMATPTITYDKHRGEPRGKQQDVSGDCINCQLCVRVCPTGIDIRDGLQLECIQCGRCADACDGVMQNLKRKTGLIRYTSEAALAGMREKRWQLRPAIYLGLILINLAILAYALGTREALKLTITRQAGTTYTQLNPTEIANYFALRVVNQQHAAQRFSLRGEPGVRVICSLCDRMIEANEEVKGNLVVIVDKSLARDQLVFRQEAGERDYIVPLLKPRL